MHHLSKICQYSVIFSYNAIKIAYFSMLFKKYRLFCSFNKYDVLSKLFFSTLQFQKETFFENDPYTVYIDLTVFDSANKTFKSLFVLLSYAQWYYLLWRRWRCDAKQCIFFIHFLFHGHLCNKYLKWARCFCTVICICI